MMRMRFVAPRVADFAANWISEAANGRKSVLGRTLGAHVRNTTVHAGEAHRTPSVFSPVQWP
jgi:hypothetical protein